MVSQNLSASTSSTFLQRLMHCSTVEFAQRLAKLPQLDLTQRIACYAQEQKSHARLYASKGRAYMSSLQTRQNNSDAGSRDHERKDAADSLIGICLGTPVLKPRVSKADSIISTRSSKSGKQASKTPSKGGVPKVKKKRVNESLSDSSRVERLGGRRERKRAKRAIVEPACKHKPQKDSEIEPHDKKCKGHNKLPPGFALMHGFTATNVGKSRLTVNNFSSRGGTTTDPQLQMEPSVSIGVFNKGKASAKARKLKLKDANKKGYFSESQFLKNKESKPRRETALKEKSPSDLRSDVIVLSTSSERDSTEAPKMEPPVLEADSQHHIVTSSVAQSVPPTLDNQGTVIINVSHQAWTRQLGDDTGQQISNASTSKTLQSIDISTHSEPSICPSQSASQRIVPIAKRSKYFSATENKEVQLVNNGKIPSDCGPDSVGPQQRPMATNCSLSDGEIIALHDSKPLPCAKYSRETRHTTSEYGYNEQPPSMRSDAQELELRQLYRAYETDDTHEDCKRAEDYAIYEDQEMHTGTLDSAYCGSFEMYEDYRRQEGNNNCDPISLPHEYFEATSALGGGDSTDDEEVVWGRGISGEDFESGYDLVEDDYSEHDCPFNPLVRDDGEGCNDHIEGEHESEGVFGLEMDAMETCDVGLDEGSSISQVDSAINDGDEYSHQPDQFCQGRALLMGCAIQDKDVNLRDPRDRPLLSSAELDVVKALRGHWFPQRL
ncbi:hypothetical protein AX17_001082 [Amanita inopinata Kibby_2008]|nr:hypothetical protein AX17_001082 [Amanita inopinata Kibby_2008]